MDQQQATDALKVSVTSRKGQKEGQHDVLVTLTPPTGAKRTPYDICCVVDISGSMGAEATMKNASGGLEAHGLSLLDIVKHAVKTVTSALQPEDSLALVIFDDVARTVFGLTQMDKAGKEKSLCETEKLKTQGSTNIWGGLKMGLDLLSRESKPGRLTALMLLTDGLPNVSPTGGELVALRNYKDQNKSLSCTINTFGFGYGINSEILVNIAREGGGMYSFIPDSSFVGTAFVNTTANLLATMGKNVTLSLEPLNGAKIAGVVGGYLTQTTSWGAQVQLCSIQYGQSKELVVQMTDLPPNDTPYLTATVRCEVKGGLETSEWSVEGSGRDGGVEVVSNYFRLRFVTVVDEAIPLMKSGQVTQAQARSLIQELVKELEASIAVGPQDPKALGLLEDLKGQVTEAFSQPDFFKKWGVHYLPSLARAHLLQQCNNFKDPGVQHYGGPLFQSLRDEIDEIFCKLPPPKPTVKSSSHQGSSKPVASMSVYHRSSNPCFHGDSMVSMADGSLQRVGDVKKGDWVLTSTQGKPARVVCVVQTQCQGGKTPLVSLPGGLLVTPYHPVRVGGQWKFPCDLAKVEVRPCTAVFSFVLAEEHVMVINGTQCVSLGHHFKGEVVGHPYFGSDLVIHDLKKMEGWESGLVLFSAECMMRDLKTDLLCGFKEGSNLSPHQQHLLVVSV